ncbi:MAG: FtsX-like permease family protein [Candidatus Poseidoniaceae archaeon]|jgi:putative ABC transport system permease protein|nr:FtsX-like permease family protein [Candidatus Poseidoniaceae archaeon]
MLNETLAVIALIAPFSVSTAWILRESVSNSWKSIVIGIGPIIDAWIIWSLLNWLDFSFVAIWTSVIAGGLISNICIAAMLSPRRLLVFRMAMENIRRRSRQSALMIAGLLVTSSIITSSLVVGDSLDATMTSEIEAIYGNTDIVISHYDKRTGLLLELDENLTSEFGSNLMSKGIIDEWSHGIEKTVTLRVSNDKAIPSLTWYAYDNWNGIAVNSVAAQELNASIGDTISITWYDVGSDGELDEESNSVILTEIISMEGKGSMSGTRSPALFTSLDLAQELQIKSGHVNRLRLSLDEDVNANKTIPTIESELDLQIGAEESGFELLEDNNTISITQTSGLGRLDSTFMESWHESKNELLLENGSHMEILQIPLSQIESQRYILTLPDDEIKQIVITEEGDWYISSGSVSFQKDRGGSSHRWDVPNGGLINDVELNGSNLIVAHTDGLTEVPNNSDIDPVIHVKNEEIFIATTTSIPLPSLPSTIFSIDHLKSGEGEWLAVKHLLGTTIYEENASQWKELNYSGEWLFYDEQIYFGSPNGWTSKNNQSIEGWNGLRNGLLLNGTMLHSITGEFLVELHPLCNGNFAVYDDDDILCTIEGGTLVSESEGLVTPRLATSIDIGSFGETPQLLLATDGNLSPPEGKILISNRLSLLPVNESIRINGLIPWAYGDASPHSLTIDGNMSSVNAPSIEELQSLIIGLVNISDGEELASAAEGERTILVISNGNVVAISSWLDEVSTTETMGLKISPVKEDALAVAESSSGVFSVMFLVFGTFTIASGVLLAITIVIMLSESRRLEGAIVRAIGLKQSDLRALTISEGMVLSGTASLLGGIFGLFLAWIISLVFSSAFSTAGAAGISFDFEWDSVVIGASSGFVIALSILWLSSLWTSRLNVVQALRDISPLRFSGIPWWFYLTLILLFGGSVIFFLYMLLLDPSSSLRHALWNLSGSMFVMGFVPIFTFAIPHLRRKGIRNAGRNTMAISGVALILWAIFPSSWAPVAAGTLQDEVTFIVLGFVEVFAGVLVLSGLAPIIANYFSRSSLFTKRIGPAATVAIAHPNASPLRTSIIMGMFSLTIFSVVVLAGYSVQFEEHSQGYVEDASGDFEILLSSSRSLPLNLTSDPLEWGLEDNHAASIDTVGQVSRAVVWVEHEEEKIPYLLRGVDDGFVKHGGLPLESWDPSLGQTEQDAWDALNYRDDIVFLDSSFALVDPNTGESMTGLTISIGESILLIDISNPGNTRSLVVGGILSESSYLFSAGIWMNNEIVEEQFGGVVTRIYVSHNSGIESAQLHDVLSDELASDGVHVTVIEGEILLILGLVFQILDIFQAYLALGLIVGIAGIGVVTYRSVSERSGQIGMLRALGFRRRLVMISLLIEILWISLLGMLNGAIIGIFFHIGLHNSFWAERGAELVLPWATTIGLLIGAIILVIIATFMPVKRASSIPPARAISSID